MIQLISGYTHYGHRLIGPKDGPVELPEDVERRLVALGAAKYADKAPENPAAPAGGDFPEKPGTNPAPAETGAEAATEGVQEQNEPMENIVMQGAPDESREILPAIGIEDMSFSQLKAVAEQMGVETKGLRSKAALISAIENAKPPDLKVME